MKPSARQRQQRAETKRDRRKRRKANAPVLVKSPCPRCGFPTPDFGQKADSGRGLIRCTVCGSVKR